MTLKQTETTPIWQRTRTKNDCNNCKNNNDNTRTQTSQRQNDEPTTPHKNKKKKKCDTWPQTAEQTQCNEQTQLRQNPPQKKNKKKNNNHIWRRDTHNATKFVSGVTLNQTKPSPTPKIANLIPRIMIREISSCSSNLFTFSQTNVLNLEPMLIADLIKSTIHATIKFSLVGAHF